MGDNLDRKKYGSPTFSWGIHIWNFKLACTVQNLCYASRSVQCKNAQNDKGS